MSAYHDNLVKEIPEYAQLSQIKFKGWSSNHFYQIEVKLAKYEEYSVHYQSTLFRILEEEKGQSSIKRVLDIGSAPGGLCHAFSLNEEIECILGVTLNEERGGLPMNFCHPKLHIAYGDVCERKEFISSVKAHSVWNAHSFDFVNAGIVLDASVKAKRMGMESVTYHEQLRTQLEISFESLRQGGWLMIASQWGYTTVPEVMETLHFFISVIKCPVVRIIPTVYSSLYAKKQFYLLVKMPAEYKSDDLSNQIANIWLKGRDRHIKYVVDARNNKRGRQELPSEKNSELTDFSQRALMVCKSICEVAKIKEDIANFSRIIHKSLLSLHII